MRDGNTYWNPPAELAKLSEGDWLLIIDELPQAVPMMQNALAGLMLDRFVGDLRLSPGVRIVATGNRTEDKAGANRIVSQLGNRVAHLQLDVHLDDWCMWALQNDVDPLLVAFMRFRPNFLHDFNPDRLSNATPRSWEMVSRSVDFNLLPRDAALELVGGLVSEGIGAEYVAYRDIASKMPNPDAVLMDPESAPVPNELGVLYALATALATRATAENFDRVMRYMERVPQRDMGVMVVKTAKELCPAVCGSKAFVTWATKNADIFV